MDKDLRSSLLTFLISTGVTNYNVHCFPSFFLFFCFAAKEQVTLETSPFIDIYYYQILLFVVDKYDETYTHLLTCVYNVKIHPCHYTYDTIMYNDMWLIHVIVLCLMTCVYIMYYTHDIYIHIMLQTCVEQSTIIQLYWLLWGWHLQHKPDTWQLARTVDVR